MKERAKSSIIVSKFFMKNLHEIQGYTPEQIARHELLRKEPLTKIFLQHLFSSHSFKTTLTQIIHRVITQHAETGFVVYKKSSSEKFKLLEKFGLPSYYDAPALIDMGADANAAINLSDGSDEKLRQLGISAENYVRIGDFHMHPYTLSFSSSDLEDNEQRILDSSIDFAVPVSAEAFRLIGFPHFPLRGERYVDLFGYSLPRTGLTSTAYQVMTGENTDRQQAILEASGFRVARARIPIIKNKISIDEKVLTELAALGG